MIGYAPCCALLIGRNAAHHETVAMHPVPDERSSMLRSRNDRSQGRRFPPPVAFTEWLHEPIRVRACSNSGNLRRFTDSRRIE